MPVVRQSTPTDEGRPHRRPKATLTIDLALGALGASYSYTARDNLAAGDFDAWLVLVAALLLMSAGAGLVARVRWAARLGQIAAGMVVMLGAAILISISQCSGGFCGVFAGAAVVIGVAFMAVGLAVWLANHRALLTRQRPG